MSIGQTCGCGWIHASDAVRSVGRFASERRGYVSFIAGKVGPLRATRTEAMLDVCPQWTVGGQS